MPASSAVKKKLQAPKRARLVGEWFGKNCTAVPTTVAPSVSTKVMSDCNRVDNRLLSSSDEHTEETIDQTITGGQSVSDLATSLVDSESELAPRVRFATERQERQTRQPWRQYHDAYSFRLLKLRDATLSQARALWEGSVSAHGFLQEIRPRLRSAQRSIPELLKKGGELFLFFGHFQNFL